MGRRKIINCDICGCEISGAYIKAKMQRTYCDAFDNWIDGYKIYICPNCQRAIGEAVRKSSQINFSVDINTDAFP